MEIAAAAQVKSTKSSVSISELMSCVTMLMAYNERRKKWRVVHLDELGKKIRESSLAVG
jgi:hypothetical protein